MITTWIAQPVILVGASLGGAVAIDVALHYPNCVRSLVLIDSVGFSGSFPVGQFLPNPLIELGADWLYFRKHAATSLASVLPMVDPTLVDALRCSLVHQEMPGWKTAISSFTQSGGYADITNRISEVSHPTLILWGERDDSDLAAFSISPIGQRFEDNFKPSLGRNFGTALDGFEQLEPDNRGEQYL